jgi:hypothetical protein
MAHGIRWELADYLHPQILASWGLIYALLNLFDSLYFTTFSFWWVVLGLSSVFYLQIAIQVPDPTTCRCEKSQAQSQNGRME